MAILEEPCCGQFRERPITTHEKVDDRAVFDGLRNLAFRDDSGLKLRIDGIRTLEIVDNKQTATGRCDPSDGCRYHVLRGWWPRHRTYVVEVLLYEGREAYLISAIDGRATPVVAPPVLSPSGRYAIAADNGVAYGNGTQLIDMATTPPTATKIATTPTCSGQASSAPLRPEAEWIDETRVRFVGVHDMFHNPDAKQTLRVVDGRRVEWEC